MQYSTVLCAILYMFFIIVHVQIIPVFFIMYIGLTIVLDVIQYSSLEEYAQQPVFEERARRESDDCWRCKRET